VTANPSIQSVFVSGSVPARAETVAVEGTQTATVTSRIPVPLTRARGVARFRNLTQIEVAIPAGTLVYTRTEPPVRFATLNPTRIPPGVDQFVEVPIEAVTAGEVGNVAADSIQTVDGSLGLMTAVTNPEPTGGGTDTTAIGPSADDRFLLRESLLADLKTQAEAQLRARLSTDDVLLTDTLAVSQTLDETYNPPADQQGTSLTLTLRVEFSVQVVSTLSLTELAEATLNAVAEPGFSPVADSLTIESVSKPVTDADGVTHWQMQAERRTLRSVDLGAALALVRGRSPQEASALLSQTFLFETKPEINLTPDWWPWLPLIPFRISVVAQ
jgi:hypothetical protein